MELYLPSLNKPSWRGARLKKKHRDNFTVYMRTGKGRVRKRFSDFFFLHISGTCFERLMKIIPKKRDKVDNLEPDKY
jgi:hypothetical protein